MTFARILATLTLGFMLTGCSTPDSVAQLHGRGNRQIFNAGYGPVWEAAVGAAKWNDLRILDSDEKTGFISARRDM